MKKLLVTLSVLLFAIAPLAHASVLGFATEQDIRNIDAQILDLSQRVIILEAKLAIKKGLLLGSATISSGFNFPTSSYSFSDNDTINAGDFNVGVLQYLGIRTATDTVSLSGRIYNASTSALKAANNLSDLTSTSSARTSLGLTDTAITPSSSFAKTANNLSDLTSTSSARTNLGLTDTATTPSSSFAKTANNLSDLNSTSAARTNLGLGSLATVNSPTPVTNGGTGTSTTPSDGQFLAASGSIPTWKTFLAGNGMIITSGSTSTQIAATSNNSASGNDSQIQYNNGGAFGATSTLTFTTSTNRLNLSAPSSSVVVGSLFNVFTFNTTQTQVLSYTGALQSWQAPTNTTSTATITVVGAGGGGTNPGKGAALSGTITLTPGQTYWAFVGQKGGDSTTTATFGGGGGAGATVPTFSGAGGGMSWLSTTSTFTPTSSMVAIAGGGGGGTGNGSGSNGGALNGQNGANGSGSGTNGGGGGGTQSAGGAGGAGSGGGGTGVSGSSQNGGQGGSGSQASGSGGGGGYFGGGGGGGDNGSGGANVPGGGGGGSSFFASTVTATSSAATSTAANGSIFITYMTYVTSTSATSGTFALASGGHIVTGGPVPTVSGCGGACTVAGNDTAGVVTNSSSTPSFTVIFANPFISNPICVVNMASGSATAFKVVSTVSAFTATATTTIATSSLSNYICLAY